MTVPHAHQQLAAFSPDWLEPLNLRTQVDRLPPVDAPCMCRCPAGHILPARSGYEVITCPTCQTNPREYKPGPTTCLYPFCKPPDHER